MHTLYLSDNEIVDISFLKDLKQLHTLDLDDNEIVNISFLKDLKQLHTLNLSQNRIDDYSFLKSLKELRSLNLSQNRIDDYSFFGRGLHRLRHISLNRNQITSIYFLEDFNELEYLSLNNNQITDIYFLTKLTRLRYLSLKNNQITNTFFLINLSRLRHLSLEHNKIQLIPLKLINSLQILGTLKLVGNPIKNIPKEIFDNSSLNVFSGVKSYLIAQAEGQIINITSKLILFGNGEAGKTTLSHQLRRNKFEQNDERTHGILIKQWTIQEDDFSKDLKERLSQIYKEIKKKDPKSEVEMPKEITLDLWDFGGQEYYHATHRLFLTNNVLYLLVWDIETNKQNEIKGEYPLEYWRENIKNNLRLKL